MTRHSPEVTEVSPKRRQEQAREERKSGRAGLYIAIALALAALPVIWALFDPITGG